MNKNLLVWLLVLVNVLVRLLRSVTSLVFVVVQSFQEMI